MERKYMLTDAMIPGIQEMSRWDKESRCIKDISINNSFAIENKVSEMSLQVMHITVIDHLDQENKIIETQNSNLLKKHHISAERSIRTGIIKSLKPAEYKKLRFYLRPFGNTYKNELNEENHIPHMPYMEFDITHGFTVNRGEFPSLLFHFDFIQKAPEVKPSRVAGLLSKSIFNRWGLKKKLVASFR